MENSSDDSIVLVSVYSILLVSVYSILLVSNNTNNILSSDELPIMDPKLLSHDKKLAKYVDMLEYTMTKYWLSIVNH